MSAPRCLRTAIEAWRPQKTNSVALSVRLAPSQCQGLQRSRRTFSATRSGSKKNDKDKPAETGAIDITAGFPMPRPDSITIQEPYHEEHFTKLENARENNRRVPPPKHTATSIQREQVKPEVVSEGQAQKLQQMPAPPTTAVHSSASPDVPPTSSKAPVSSRHFSKPAANPKTALAPTSQSGHAPSPPQLDEHTKPNVPPNVLAAYRTPLYHPLTHGIPVAQLQLRSFNTRNLEFFADFCVRAAYYLSLPCTGPTPLPKKIERWTVLKSNFVNKKAQENFERITLKRLITVYDGNPAVVETWLAFVRRWQYHGVGMKANVWGWESVDVASKMDRDFSTLEEDLDAKLRLFGFNKHVAEKRDLLDLMDRQNHRREGIGMSEVRERARPKEPGQKISDHQW